MAKKNDFNVFQVFISFQITLTAVPFSVNIFRNFKDFQVKQAVLKKGFYEHAWRLYPDPDVVLTISESCSSICGYNGNNERDRY